MKSTTAFKLLCSILALVGGIKGFDSSAGVPGDIIATKCGTSRITNGHVATPGQFPYQVLLTIFFIIGISKCGGSVISESWVLTAAHCVDSNLLIVDVYLGTWDKMNSTEEGQQIISVPPSNIIIHEEWDIPKLLNDIALIKLPDAVKFSEYIQPVSLPKKSSSSFAGEKAIASGWGAINDAGDSPDELRWAEINIISNEECGELTTPEKIDSSQICTEIVEGVGVCYGDSGGPLVLSNTRTLVGVTSYYVGASCETAVIAGFTRVTSYLDWIGKHTGIAVE